MLCKLADKDSAMLVAEKLRQIVKRYPFMMGDERITVTISAGVASLPNPYGTRTPEELFEQADFALYCAKTHGRDRVTHYDELHGRGIRSCKENQQET